jgi:DNA-binding MarR family transcriptional regulator
MEVVPVMMRHLRGEMRRYAAPRLSLPQFRALAFLDRNPGCCLSDVADHLGVTRPTASVIVDRLVRRRLVFRSDDPQERRRIVLRLSPEGTRLLQRAREATRSWIVTLLATSSEADLRQMTEGLTLVGGVFKAKGGMDGK